jgi:hypothetical protein
MITDVPDVPALERLAARSWRGLEEERHGDWLLRAGGGFTGRANSVLVAGEPAAGLDDAVAAVTRWYTDRGLRPRAQVPMPGAERADAALAAAGWVRDDDNLVLTASLAGWSEPAVPVDLAPEPDDAWLDGYRYRGTPCLRWRAGSWSTPTGRCSPPSGSRRRPRPWRPSPGGCSSTAGCASPPSPSTRAAGDRGWPPR